MHTKYTQMHPHSSKHSVSGCEIQGEEFTGFNGRSIESTLHSNPYTLNPEPDETSWLLFILRCLVVAAVCLGYKVSGFGFRVLGQEFRVQNLNSGFEV
jgi:hypothetical protein